MVINIFTGSWYLGGFVSDRAADDSCQADKVQGWTESVKTLSGVACKHPHSAYAELQKSLKQEWAFVQRVTPGIRDAFGPVEQALRENSIPSLLQVLGEGTQCIWSHSYL